MTQLDQLQEFNGHRGVFSFVLDTGEKKTRGFIALHRGSETIPAFGATRYTEYASEEDALQDALRLSRGMSYKSAFAKTPYAGGKGVIIKKQDHTDSDKRKFLIEYAKVVSMLRGGFVTGSDVGITEKEVKLMGKHSKHIVGTKLDATKYTGVGLNAALRAGVKHVFGEDDLTNRSIAIQGLGKVGCALLLHILEEAKEVFVTDTDSERLVVLAKKYKNLRVVEPEDIFSVDADIFAPCALAGALSPHTVQQLKVKLVVGGANNQLSDPSVAQLLHSQKITYIPDYIANAGGFMSVVHEYEHGTGKLKQLEKKIGEIGLRVKGLLEKSDKERRSPSEIANDIAERWITQKY